MKTIAALLLATFIALPTLAAPTQEVNPETLIERMEDSIEKAEAATARMEDLIKRLDAKTLPKD